MTEFGQFVSHVLEGKAIFSLLSPQWHFSAPWLAQRCCLQSCAVERINTMTQLLSNYPRRKKKKGQKQCTVWLHPETQLGNEGCVHREKDEEMKGKKTAGGKKKWTGRVVIEDTKKGCICIHCHTVFPQCFVIRSHLRFFWLTDANLLGNWWEETKAKSNIEIPSLWVQAKKESRRLGEKSRPWMGLVNTSKGNARQTSYHSSLKCFFTARESIPS